MKNLFRYGLILVIFCELCFVIDSKFNDNYKAIYTPISYARYESRFNKIIKLNIREPVYTIIYNANGGTGTMNSKEFTYNEESSLDKNTFKKYGYSFKGWNTNSNGTGIAYNDEATIYNLTSIDGSEITIYAQFENIVNIRISNATLNGSSNASSSNLEFDFDNLTSNITLSNSDSYVTYQIDVDNYLSKNMGIYSITGLPDNLEYEIVNDYNIKEKLCDASNGITPQTGQILLKIKYKDGGYSSGNTSYNLDLDFVFKEVYNITYSGIYSANNYPNTVNLNNFPVDINSIHYPTQIMQDDTMEIEFYPHIPTSVSVDGATSSYEKPSLTISGATGDVTVSNLSRGEFIVFDHPDSYSFTGNNNIDTGIQLFSTTNNDKDFRVSFTIDSRDNNQESMATLFNSMDESGSPWPGIMFRIDNGIYMIESNGAKATAHSEYNFNAINKVEIERIDNVVYLRINDGEKIRFADYNGSIRNFNVTSTFGSSKNGNGNPMRYFKGSLSNMEIRYLDNEAGDVPDIPEDPFIVAYEHVDVYTFNGDNLNSNVSLFTEENFNRDFEITLTIDNVGSGNGNDKNTILNSMYENAVNQSGKSDYPGFAFRIEDGNYVLTANMDDEMFTYAINQSNPNDNLRTIKFTRQSGVLYYQINDKTPVRFYDFGTGSTPYFDTPVTFGSSLTSNGTLQRTFTGSLSNMVIKIAH